MRRANRAKRDEFYTQLVDIERELRHYKHFFEGKTVFCNCDDPFESNFFRYFAINFNHLGLKKLICTSYAGSPIAHTELDTAASSSNGKKLPYKIEITEVPDMNDDGATDLADIELLLRSDNNNLTILDDDGDFRSEECIEFLKESDVVVTNPPFSLFREYVAQLIQYKKKFLIIGNNNAITYRDIFVLLKNNEAWLGYNVNKTIEFRLNNDYEKWDRLENGVKYGKVPAITWFTNIDIDKRHEELILYKTYDATCYSKYDNYDAINIDRVTDIPKDYDGAMGVPITFLDKYNPDQFDIKGLGIANLGLSIGVRPYLPEHKKYRKEVQHKGAVDGDLYMLDEEGHPVVPYARILIERKKHEN